MGQSRSKCVSFLAAFVGVLGFVGLASPAYADSTYLDSSGVTNILGSSGTADRGNLVTVPTTVTVNQAKVAFNYNTGNTSSTLSFYSGSGGAVGSLLGTLTYASLVRGSLNVAPDVVTYAGNAITIPAGTVWIISSSPGTNTLLGSGVGATGTWTFSTAANAGLSGFGPPYNYYTPSYFVVVSVSSVTPSVNSGTAVVLPPDILQSVGLPASGNCVGIDDKDLNWAGATSGGWTASWAQWMNAGKGGAVCSRFLAFSPTTNTWFTRK